MLVLQGPFALGQPACSAAADVSVAASVQVAGEEISLADLLGPTACPTLRRAAAGIRIGGAPLPGSVRVLGREDARALFAELYRRTGNGAGAWTTLTVPERIVIRRTGRLASCPEIAAQVLASLPSGAPPTPSILEPQPDVEPFSVHENDIDCGAEARIAENAPLEATRTVWNPALASWEISARCVHPSDCVPFLVRVHVGGAPAAAVRQRRIDGIAIGQIAEASGKPGRVSTQLSGEKAIVRPGQRVRLVWEQDGIRVVIPAISLDGGGLGEDVRARLSPSGHVVHATVASAGLLHRGA